jgi:hypothetical protein
MPDVLLGRSSVSLGQKLGMASLLPPPFLPGVILTLASLGGLSLDTPLLPGLAIVLPPRCRDGEVGEGRERGIRRHQPRELYYGALSRVQALGRKTARHAPTEECIASEKNRKAIDGRELASRVEVTWSGYGYGYGYVSASTATNHSHP